MLVPVISTTGRADASDCAQAAGPAAASAVSAAQLIRLALPGFTNNWLVLAKATALVSLIGLQDVMFRAKGAAEATGMPFTFYLIAAGFYLFVTVFSLILLALLARRFEIDIRELAP